MYGMRLAAFRWLCLVIPLAFDPAGAFAAGYPWRAAEQADLDGIWTQVGVVVLDPESDAGDPWFQAKQFFRFPADGGYKHVLVNPDSEPGRATPNEMQLFMLNQAPTVQTLKWHSRGIGMLKHPERPQQRIDFGLYLRDMPTGPNNSALQPKIGDLILVYYDYRDVNAAWYYRLLRKLP